MQYGLPLDSQSHSACRKTFLLVRTLPWLSITHRIKPRVISLPHLSYSCHLESCLLPLPQQASRSSLPVTLYLFILPAVPSASNSFPTASACQVPTHSFRPLSHVTTWVNMAHFLTHRNGEEVITPLSEFLSHCTPISIVALTVLTDLPISSMTLGFLTDTS